MSTWRLGERESCVSVLKSYFQVFGRLRSSLCSVLSLQSTFVLPVVTCFASHTARVCPELPSISAYRVTRGQPCTQRLPV